MDDLKGYLSEKHIPTAIKDDAIAAYVYFFRKKSLIGESGVLLLSSHGIKDMNELWNQFYYYNRDLRSFESYLMGLGLSSQSAQECALYLYVRADDMDQLASQMSRTNIVYDMSKRSKSPIKK
jgi:hypothetical protein